MIELFQARAELKPESPVLLVLGDGESMPSDLDTFLSWGIEHDVGALGRGIKDYPGRVHHWFNGDGETAIQWAKNLPNGNGTIKHTCGHVDGFDVDWDWRNKDDYHYGTITGEGPGRSHGSSAMFATLAGLYMGYDRIVLAGCPLDSNGHYYWPEKTQDTLGPLWMGFDMMAWIDFRDSENGHRVRSLSGYTAKIMGYADKKWVQGE